MIYHMENSFEYRVGMMMYRAKQLWNDDEFNRLIEH